MIEPLKPYKEIFDGEWKEFPVTLDDVREFANKIAVAVNVLTTAADLLEKNTVLKPDIELK